MAAASAAKGFWMAVGAGIGGLGCDCRTDGGGPEAGLVTNLALGGAANSRVVGTDFESFAATDRLGIGLSVGAGYDFRVTSGLR